MNVLLIASAVLILSFGHWIKARRWSVILSVFEPAGVSRLLGCMAVGQAVNMVVVHVAVQEHINIHNPQLAQHHCAAGSHSLVPAFYHPHLAVIHQDRFIGVPDVRKPDFQQLCVFGE